MTDESPTSSRWFEGKLLWIGDNLYQVMKVGLKSDGSSLIPVVLKKVEW